jgi:hypothetical protein
MFGNAKLQTAGILRCLHLFWQVSFLIVEVSMILFCRKSMPLWTLWSLCVYFISTLGGKLVLVSPRYATQNGSHTL